MEGNFRCRLTTWDELQGLAKKVATKVKRAQYKPDMIIALARGGLVPARQLSDFLAIKDVAAIKIEHWGVTANKDQKAVLKYPISIDLSGKKVLVVDDITDTGESLMVAIEFLKTLKPAEIRTSTLQHIPGSKCVPDFYGEALSEWTWIVYPWNFLEDMMSLVGKILGAGRGEMNSAQIKDELSVRHGLKISEDSILEVMEHMDYEGKVDIVNKEGSVFWKMKRGMG